jgi:hypothetical protein
MLSWVLNELFYLPTLWTDSSYLHVHNASWWQSKMQIRFFDCRQLQPQSRRPTVLLTFWSTPQASFRSRTWYNQVDCISTSNHILALQPQFCKHKFPSSNLSETKFFLLSPVCHRDYTKQGSEVIPDAGIWGECSRPYLSDQGETHCITSISVSCSVVSNALLASHSDLTKAGEWIDPFLVSTCGHYWRLEVAPRPGEDSHWLQIWALESVW